ncbi:MAG: TetR/AcrR family transcriptional regulator, partial [Bacteroidota bacterium]
MKVKDQQKVADLFKATLELTESVGLAGLKMSEIARHANLASGTIYVYFNSKETLLNELYSKLKKESINQLQIDRTNSSFKIEFKKVWLASLAYRLKHQRETIFMMQFRNSPFISDYNKSITDQYLVELESFICRGVDEQLIKNIDIQTLIATILGLLNEFSMIYSP